MICKPVSLKWVFIYKLNKNGFLNKYKARLVVKGDLQEMNTQNVYAVTLTFKVFHSLMALVAAFGLKTRQLNAVNAFLNAKNDESIYCFLSDGYRRPEKIMKVLRAFYGQRKSSLLWLRTLSMKCIEMRLHQISNESWLFINGNSIILFFYVNDIVIASRPDQRDNVDFYVKRLMKMFEIRNLDSMKFFLEVRIIRKKGTVSLMQNIYIEKLMKKYEIDPINMKAFVASIPVDLEAFDDEFDIADTHQYRKMIGSICYSAVGTRPDIVKAASKLSEFLINPGLGYMKAVMQCLCYLYATKSLEI